MIKNPEHFFSGYEGKTITIQKIQSDAFVQHSDNSLVPIADELTKALRDCQIVGASIGRQIEQLKVEKKSEHLNTNIGQENEVENEIFHRERILSNQRIIFMLVDTLLKESPCELNLYHGIVKVIEEFPYEGILKHPNYFLPDFDVFSMNSENEATVEIGDGDFAIVYGVSGEKNHYKLGEYIDSLVDNVVKANLGPYIIRTPYQMLMTIAEYACEEHIIFRKCENCGKLFQANHALRKYCSRKCSEERKKDQTQYSQNKEINRALANFKQAARNSFERYRQGKTNGYPVDILKIPNTDTDIKGKFEIAIKMRDKAGFYNALDLLIQSQRESLNETDYLLWLETAGRKRHGYSRNKAK